MAGKRSRHANPTSGFDKLADKDGFLVVYPDGIERNWNDGRMDEKQTTMRIEIISMMSVSSRFNRFLD
jgi:polyhydroxybutyrate depolymerase